VSIFKLQSAGTVKEQINRHIAKKAYAASKIMEDMHANRDTHAVTSMIHPQSPNNAMYTEGLSSLITSRAHITSDQLNATQLIWFVCEAILGLCTTTQVKGQNLEKPVVTADQELALLACTERVKTNIFDGKRIVL
jgi:SWI/SNF-related matrix-associated actin-dependent regulator of chromatin subfamily A member 5